MTVYVRIDGIEGSITLYDVEEYELLTEKGLAKIIFTDDTRLYINLDAIICMGTRDLEE